MKEIIAFILVICVSLIIMNRKSDIRAFQLKSHTCIDGTHQTCDGECICDGFECTGIVNPAISIISGRDYQIELIEDSILIFDGSRYVGRLPVNWNKPTALDSIFIKDNK